MMPGKERWITFSIEVLEKRAYEWECRGGLAFGSGVSLPHQEKEGLVQVAAVGL